LAHSRLVQILNMSAVKSEAEIADLHHIEPDFRSKDVFVHAPLRVPKT